MRRRGPTPRTQIAAKLYATGAVKSMREASLAVGQAPNTLYFARWRDPKVREDMDRMLSKIDDRAVDTTVLLEMLSRKALSRIAQLMEYSDNEAIQLKAAVDLADRGPNTSKIQRHQVESFTLGSQDVAKLAESMVAAAKMKQDGSLAQFTEGYDGTLKLTNG